jgi:diamine N-acetyltransferase
MIVGKRIRLRAIDRPDLSFFAAWLDDPEVTAGLMHIIPMSLTDEERWFNSMIERPLDEHPLAIDVREEGGWKLIGDIGLAGIDARNRAAEVGIFIGDKRFWNQGYGSEAMTLMLRHAFQSLNLHRVMLRVYDTNPRAIRAYEKVGFIHEGRLRQAEYRFGRYIDVLVMSVLKDEWKEAPE